MLQKDRNMPYELKRMKVDAKLLKDRVLSSDRFGNYLYQLESRIGQCLHVVGIGTVNNKIHDCLEDYILDLNIQNLIH